MNDREYREQKRRLHTLIRWWVRWSGAGNWTVDSNYDRTGDTFHDGDVIARTTADWRYLSASIDWNMPRVIEQSDDELEYGVVHELMHIQLNQIWGARVSDDVTEGVGREVKAHEESIATHLAKALIWVRDRARVEAGKD